MNVSRPRLLDLFAGAGGAARGYQMAGFHVTGVDYRPQPRYAGDVFTLADALDFAREYGHDYAAIHASPPCQRYSACAAMPGRSASSYPALIHEVRDALRATGRPFVIENVPRAPLQAPIILCGQMFGLLVYRHRAFESGGGVHLMAPPCPGHSLRMAAGGLNRYFGTPGQLVTVAGHQFSRASGSVAMGIDWMTRDELPEAIPPAYTELIGKQLMHWIENGEPVTWTSQRTVMAT